MRKLHRATLFLLFGLVIFLFEGCARRNSKIAPLPHPLKEIFIDPKDKKTILERSENGDIVKILGIGELPKEMDGFGSLKGFPLKASSFLQVSSSLDNTKVAFVVLLAEIFHADSAGWEGVLDRDTNTIIQLGALDKDYLQKISLSPFGKYLLDEYEFPLYPSEDPYYPILITNIGTRRVIFRMGGDILTEKVIRDLKLKKIIRPDFERTKPYEYLEVDFLKWSEDEKSMYFKFIKIKENYQIGARIPPKRLKETNFGLWRVNLDGSGLKKIRK